MEQNSNMVNIMQDLSDEELDMVVEFWLEHLQNSSRLDSMLPFLIYEKQRRLELWED